MAGGAGAVSAVGTKARNNDDGNIRTKKTRTTWSWNSWRQSLGSRMLASSLILRSKNDSRTKLGGTHETCEICLAEIAEDDEMLGLRCGHSYCSTCWHGYLSTELGGNLGGRRAIRTACPDPSCTELVTTELLQRVAPALRLRFDEHLLDAFVGGNRGIMRWCPGPDCRRIAIKPRDGILNVGFGCSNGNTMFCGGKDGCGGRFCFLCGGEPHGGLCPVEALQAQGNQEQNEEGPNNPLATETPDVPNPVNPIQRCPKCKSPIEKNGGCNHMTCTQCSCHFCWLCNAEYTDGGHFCGRWAGQRRGQGRDARMNPAPVPAPVPAPALPRPVNLDYVREAMEEKSLAGGGDDTERTMLHDLTTRQEQMEQFAHYYNRFVAHSQGQQFAEGQCGCVQGRADDFCKISGIISTADTDFFAAANKRLVACRCMLKYSYCYVYHMIKQVEQAKGSGASDYDGNVYGEECASLRIALFENKQERLERFTEQLSEVLETAITRLDRMKVIDLMDVVDLTMNALCIIPKQEVVDYQKVN